jgi:CheY-like chemotaxis protein
LIKYDIDLIIQDIVRPVGMDGITFLKWLRRQNKWSRLPVILNTLTSKEDCRETLRMANVWYLDTPLKKEHLTRLIKQDIGLN